MSLRDKMFAADPFPVRSLKSSVNGRLRPVAAAVTAYMANYRPDPFDLLNANIEALAQDESLDPG